MYQAQDVYDKLKVGANLTPKEAQFGLEFYSDLARKLEKCGPVFSLAANEAQYVTRKLSEYVVTRAYVEWKIDKEELVPKELKFSHGIRHPSD